MLGSSDSPDERKVQLPWAKSQRIKGWMIHAADAQADEILAGFAYQPER